MGDDYHSTVRLNESQQRQLLDGVKSQQRAVEESKRNHERIDCHLTNVQLIVTHPDGDIARFLVSTRNISAGGVAFIHGGFLYPGCKCEIMLPTVWGGTESLTGKIVLCRHLEKHVHEVSMSFDALIDRRRFITLPGERALESELDTSKVAVLAGKVLIIDECIINADLAQHHIKYSKVEVIAVETLADGLENLKSSPFDTVILDLDNTDETSEKLIHEIREVGYKGPVLCASCEPESEDSKVALAAGADEVIAHPISANALVNALTESLSGSANASGPVRCQLENSPDTVALIENYLKYIEQLQTKLTEAIEANDLEIIKKSCKVISQSAGGYGYPPLEKAAIKAIQALDETEAVKDSLTELQRLQSVCQRLEPMQLN